MDIADLITNTGLKCGVSISILDKGDDPLFNSRDIGKLLGLSNIRESIRSFNKDEIVRISQTDSIGRQNVKKVKDTSIKCIVMSPENSTIGFICNAIKPLFTEMIRQFIVEKYRVDLYIPDIKLCVECDEEGHRDYNASMEAERQACIENKLSCCFIRFNPNADGFDISDVIANILKTYKTMHQAYPSSN